MDASRRWILPDLASALSWVKERSGQRIRCTLALAGEYARTPEAARSEAEETIACAGSIASLNAGASLSVKPSAVGGIFDQTACREHLIRIARETARLRVPLELDMEGKGSVDLTLSIAAGCRRENPLVTVALQAYLERTPGDIRRMVAEGISIRLVKGAYLGDTSDFAEIQRLTEEDAGILKSLRAPFSLGTHDPELIARIRRRFEDGRDLVEFGFLLGLSDQTKAGLAAEGWRVSEYVPFGPGGDAYTLRRERYLRDLAASGRAPAP
jgi:proline dehydrogenase